MYRSEHAARSHRRPRRRLRSRWPAPYLRGFGPTRFRSPQTPRDGRGVALAHDAIELMDLLGITRFAVAGHDWGARAAYTLAALFPDRVVAAAALALPHQPGGLFTTPSFAQSRLLPRTLASGALRPR